MQDNPIQERQGPRGRRRRAPAPEQAPRSDTAQGPRRRSRRRGPRNPQSQSQNQNRGNEQQRQENQEHQNRGQNNQKLNKKKITKKKQEILKNKFLEVFKDIDSINRHFQLVGLNPVESIDEAVEILKGLWINICDFLDGELILFQNERELRKYTIKNKKFFPKNVAKQNNLQHFLIKML